MRSTLTVGALLVAFALPAAAETPSPAIRAALADPGRPPADIAKDTARHTDEVLAYARVKPGAKVADFIMGGGYLTRVLAKAVGPNGRVYAYQPAEFIKFRPAYGDEQKAASAPYADVTPLSQPLGEVAFPEPLDVIITVQNYHDMHLKAFGPTTASKADAAMFKALKPGGTLLVIDHVAEPGVADAPDTLHRIDPAVIRQELTAAGFRFDGELNVLRNKDDPHTMLVFNPAIRGHTDQVVYRFRKPR